jgi:FtsP/CotA-like multicopper oxidase with cupredoxin domain
MAEFISRRKFIGLGAGAALGATMVKPAWGDEISGFQPEIIESRRGRLKTTLTIEKRRMVVAGREVDTVVYNGTFPGPTLVADPGDRMDVRLVNKLDEHTNLHTHGFHVRPDGNSDNVFLHLAPGESFDFRFDLPRNHAPGLNWYHPHVHGTGTQQIFGGAAGAIVIRGEHDHWRVRDRVFVLQTPEWDAEGKLKTFTPGLLRSQLRLVNGQLNPTIDIRHGETQRWRFVNASVNSVFKLALEGHELLQIATDGNPGARAVKRDSVVISPGQRVELLVRGGAAGAYALKALPYDHGFGAVSPECTIATVACRAAFPSWPVSPVPLLQPFHDLRRRRVERKRELRFSITGGFHINGKAFDENRVDETVELGAIEEWTVYNDSGLMHPFHIHINPFQLTHVNGQPVDEPGYYDTYPVDPNGSITFRTHFMDFTGKSFFHCHLILHSDIGMMGVFEVVRRRKPWASAEDQYDALCEIA